jgi:tetratricopeptide (TPR) repeat protein
MISASLQQICDRAVRLHQQGDLAGAERLYIQLMTDDPAAFTPRHLLGIVRAQQGKPQEAIALIAAALEIDPLAASAWLNHGNILSTMGRYADAITSYDRALTLRPGDVEILHNRARTFLEMGSLENALANYDQVLDIRRHDPTIWNDRGNILWSLGRDEDARVCYEKVLHFRPRNVEALNNLGNVLRSQRRFQEALLRYDKALAENPGLAETLSNRGVTLLELGRFAEALVSLDQSLKLNPELAEAWNNRGDVLRAMNRPDDALASFDHALSLSPAYPAALNNRAKLLCEADRIAEGFDSFLQAAALAYGEAQTGLQPEHKVAHDAAQRLYLADCGQAPDTGLHLYEGARLPHAALQAANWREEVADRWETASPQVAVIDNFLTTKGLAALQRFCWRSTIWRRAYDGGYLGAFPESGFACPLLAQIAEELRDVLPAVFAGHPLRYLWAFKYDSKGAGTHVHADEAAVNVNFWITPDDANRDPESGGLVVWNKAASPDWDFSRFNADAEASNAFLARSDAKPTTIPYRANRAVIFNSNLFHQTDRFDFAPGYLNRRINITLLYGRR